MRRLLWVGVGVALTVLVIRKGRALVDEHLPAGTTDAVEGAVRLTRVARTTREAFTAGMAEREQQLRHDLYGDVDLDELRERRDARRRPPAADRRRSAAVPPAWAEHPVEDPDDDDGYTFF
ncbi:hypothetical protein [Cellulomonas soli]|uniref:Uncharacterized protein n=1 Tax=Cellulomonas soli TaxID=931535 RepID=A0A512PA62_9CELL|nr:hypothetical protein [Cellulomonas soli]NYI60588.1 hypothetical protein [Cellulomonas soli]GEP68103.1 hypothetical protein CSO01_08180 [Cellulomonas soli]